MLDDRQVVFVEVRSAARDSKWLRYSISRVKQRRLIRASSCYFLARPWARRFSFRFDVAWVEGGRVEHGKTFCWVDKPAVRRALFCKGMKRRIFPVTVAVLLMITLSTDAFALDKRLKMLFKTAGYGAAAGFVIGAATTAMGLGGFRNILMGTSSGLYAGIALAGYIILTPPDNGRSGPRGRNPYAPKKPVGPDDYENDDEQIQEMVPNRDQPQSSVPMLHQLRLADYGGPRNTKGAARLLSGRP